MIHERSVVNPSWHKSLELSVKLLDSTGSIPTALQIGNGQGLWLVPQLLSPSAFNTQSPPPSIQANYVSLTGRGGGAGAIAYLYEYNNPIVNINLWHLGASLQVSNFTTGSSGWSATIDAAATFFGVFPLGPYGQWIATPEVQVTASNSGATSGYITDPILAYNTSTATWSAWSDQVPLNGPFVGYYSATEYVVG